MQRRRGLFQKMQGATPKVNESIASSHSVAYQIGDPFIKQGLNCVRRILKLNESALGNVLPESTNHVLAPAAILANTTPRSFPSLLQRNGGNHGSMEGGAALLREEYVWGLIPKL